MRIRTNLMDYVTNLTLATVLIGLFFIPTAGGPGVRGGTNQILGAPLFRVLCERVGGSARTLQGAGRFVNEE